MKKVWNDAMLEELDITATASGGFPTNEIDSGIYWNEERGSYAVDVGKKALSQSPLQN